MADLQSISINIEVDTTKATEKVAVLTAQVDSLLEKLEKCKGLCNDCKLKVNIPEISLALRAEDYRAMRSL